MNAGHGFANAYHRYHLPETVTLVAEVDATDRFVRITPLPEGALVEHGRQTLSHGTVAQLIAAPAEPFGSADLNAAIQRFCALVATWLDRDEWEIEQTRQSFLARP